MKRQVSIWVVAVLVLLGVFVGMEINQLISGDNLYEQLRKFQDVLSYTEKYYVEEVEIGKLTETAITSMLEKLDPHSIYIPPRAFENVTEQFRGKFEGIGISFRVLNDTITVVEVIGGGPSAKIGILSNDKIVKIDGNPSIGMNQEDVVKKLRGPKGTRVTVTIIRAAEKEPLVFEIIRDEIPLYSVDTSIMINDEIGYISVNKFNEQTGQEMERALRKLREQGMKKLVLDLRGNPGGYLEEAVRMADQFLDGGEKGEPKKIVYTKARRPEFEEVYFAKSGDAFEQLPLVILIGPASASASEIVAGAVQDWDRGLIVGETSFGKGLVQRQWKLADGSAFRLTIAKYYTPSGRLIQRDFKGKEREAYTREVLEREEAEGDNIEHKLESDSAKPVFRTHGGRIVYGGGGITPDYVVKSERLSATAATLRNRDMFYQFIVKYLDGPGLNLRATYAKDFKKFRDTYSVGDKMIQEFKSFVESREIKIDEKEFTKDLVFIKTWLKAHIARAFWGNDGWYPIVLEMDTQFKKGVSLFPEAEKIAKLN
ncbi:MAG TPA: S41 family peptidase [Bacteroidota bacterium]|nr:S41 family peptidase [Bacteroidota bacterium]